MNSYVFAFLLACVAAPVFGEECWKADAKRDAIVTECKEKTGKETHADKEAEQWSMWSCIMCKMEITTAEGTMDMSKIKSAIDQYALTEKRQALQDAATACIPDYDKATEKKVEAFYKCYGQKLYKEICPA